MKKEEMTTMSRVLIIEDDPLITEPIVDALELAGFEVLLARNGRRGFELALQDNPDIILLDIMLPEMDGWEVCKQVRQSSTVPIIMVTALSDDIDRVLGLEIGADDYITKPFNTRELIARIKAMLRRVAFDRQTSKPDPILTIGDIALHLDARRAFKGDNELVLRYKEFELLSLLMQHPGIAVTRAELFDQVWGTDWLGDTRTLDVHIRWLREKLENAPSEPLLVQTVRGVGYRFITQEEFDGLDI